MVILENYFKCSSSDLIG